jgi:hypothetical protein
MSRVIALLMVAACGYQPLYATPSGEAFHVHLAGSKVSSSLVAEEVVRGARDVLAKEGALAPGDGYPRLEIEVLRADETSEGIMQTESLPNAGGSTSSGTAQAPTAVPRARATDVALVARAWITRRAGASMELDTGDVRAEDLAGAPLGDATRELWQREDTLRAIAHRLGGRIALRILGHPTTTASPD